MTVTRVPLCGCDFCPEPSNPDWHVCVVCGALDVQHDHFINRGMGGSPSRKYDKGNVIALCAPCHENVTLNIWTKATSQTLDGLGTRQWIQDEHGATLWEREIPGGSDDRRTSEPNPEDAGSDPVGDRSAVGTTGGEPGQNELAVGEVERVRKKRVALDDGLLAVQRDGPSDGEEARSLPALQGQGDDWLTSWCQRGMALALQGDRIKHVTTEWRLAVGDWINEGTERTDEAYQYLEPFRGDEALRQYARVARAFPLGTRVPGASYKMLLAAAPMAWERPQEAQQAVQEAVDEGLGTREFQARLSPPSPATAPVLRLTPAEFLQRYLDWPERTELEYRRSMRRGMTAFVEWLQT